MIAAVPMTLSAVVAALLLASPTAPQRRAYNDCLEKFAVKSIEEKMETAAFEAAVATACASELNALKQAAVATGLKEGRKKADLEQIVAGDIEDYQLDAKDLFKDFKAKAEKPPTS